MSKNLVIVESPSKSKTIEKYLGSDYTVLSSKGHVRDLSTKGKFGFGVDIENNFKPDYVTIKGKKKDIDTLKKEVKSSEHVYLATDPDREGEAISWHLYDVLGLNNNNYDRIRMDTMPTKNFSKVFMLIFLALYIWFAIMLIPDFMGASVGDTTLCFFYLWL